MHDIVSHVLEEIQMPPRLLLEVVRWALRATHRTGVFRAPFAAHLQVQFMRLFVHVNADEFPRLFAADL